MSKEPFELTLITNLWYVTINDVRMSCHALMIDRNITRGIWKLRGFGTEAAWQVFDFDLTSSEFEITEDVLSITGAPKILLWRDNDTHVDVSVFDLDPAVGYATIYAELEKRVAKHWHAPYMPRLVHLSPAMAMKTPSRAGGG